VSDESERDVKQRLRRQALWQRETARIFEPLVYNRVDAHGPEIEKVSYAQFKALIAEYNQAVAEGTPDRCDFTPFSVYCTNILYYADGRPRPKPLRPFVKNEVGMRKGKYIVIEDADLDGTPSTLVQVPGGKDGV
jgi:hypothetical protein